MSRRDLAEWLAETAHELAHGAYELTANAATQADLFLHAIRHQSDLQRDVLELRNRNRIQEEMLTTLNEFLTRIVAEHTADVNKIAELQTAIADGDRELAESKAREAAESQRVTTDVLNQLQGAFPELVDPPAPTLPVEPTPTSADSGGFITPDPVVTADPVVTPDPVPTDPTVTTTTDGTPASTGVDTTTTTDGTPSA